LTTSELANGMASPCVARKEIIPIARMLTKDPCPPEWLIDGLIEQRGRLGVAILHPTYELVSASKREPRKTENKNKARQVLKAISVLLHFIADVRPLKTTRPAEARKALDQIKVVQHLLRDPGFLRFLFKGDPITVTSDDEQFAEDLKNLKRYIASRPKDRQIERVPSEERIVDRLRLIENLAGTPSIPRKQGRPTKTGMTQLFEKERLRHQGPENFSPGLLCAIIIGVASSSTGDPNAPRTTFFATAGEACERLSLAAGGKNHPRADDGTYPYWQNKIRDVRRLSCAELIWKVERSFGKNQLTAFGADSVAVAVAKLVQRDHPGGLVATASELLTMLNATDLVSDGIRKHSTWPATPQKIRYRLDRIAPLLKSQGFKVEERRGRAWEVGITPPNDEADGRRISGGWYD
jgi:hypothetical protein